MKGNVCILMIASGIITGAVNATTLSDMRAINASQKPGMTVSCKELTEFTVKGVPEPVRTEHRLTDQVMVNDGDRMVYDVTDTRQDLNTLRVFYHAQYRLTTTLEKTRQKMEVDPATIRLSLPYARHMEAGRLANLKENVIMYDDFSRYRITTLPAYEILTGPENPDAAVMYCTTLPPG